MDERVARARQLCERTVFGGDDDVLAEAERELDAAEADLALARGQILHARFLDARQADPQEQAYFERAAELYRRLRDDRGEGEALFWLGCFHQVVQGEAGVAVRTLERALELSTRTGDTLTRSYELRHLAIADHADGRLDDAGARLEESTRLRRDLGFAAGVAANLVGLVHLAVDRDRLDEARALADQAEAIAEGCGANRVVRQVEEARARIASARDG